ncbi:hypothetical protein [Streptococcus parauberis]|uniref:hypothetical protein n=1 Tax=Streptococcus parauberis TaxID=1348 RepID=UPI00020CBF4D|nr:hypothetical protein [Streptococcus parauberis]AEF25321.1 hypothetical protein STP_0873 [Streptococcus parauberis KCTC 11537]UWM91898.1 hypothetical protein N2A94_04495 [Streptococcus parauberis]
MKYFKEKIQNIRISHKNNNQTPLAVAYDFKNLPQNLEVIVTAELFNVKIDKQYVLQITFICSSDLSALHLLNNVLLKPVIEDMIKIDDDYGLTYGTFSTVIPFETYGEYELKVDLLDYEKIERGENSVLDSYKTYIVVGEK